MNDQDGISVARNWLREQGDSDQADMASDNEVREMVESTYPGGVEQFRRDFGLELAE